MIINFNPITSVILYFSIFLFTSFLVNKSKNNKIFFFLSLIFIVLLFGFRYCGTDIITYEHVITRFATMPIIDILNFNNLSEGIGFQIISHYFFKIGGFSLVNIIIGLLILCPVYTVLYRNRNNTNIFLFSIIYLIAFFTVSFNIMRQFVAVSFVFLGYDYLMNNQLKKYFLCLAIGFLFHTIAILGIVFWMINIIFENSKNHTKKGYFKVGLSILIILLIMLFSIRYIGISSYAGYVENAKAGGNRDFIVILFKFLILTIFKNRLSKIDSNINYYFLFCIITLLIGTTGFMSAYIKRLYYYFNIFECFSFALLPRIFKQKRLVSNTVIVFYTCIFILTTLVIPQGHIVPLVLRIGG